jgi:hypothetical protein
MEYSVVEYLVRCFGDEGECFLRDSDRSYTGCVAECRFGKFKNANAFAVHVAKFVACGEVRMRVKGEKFIVSVPV